MDDATHELIKMMKDALIRVQAQTVVLAEVLASILAEQPTELRKTLVTSIRARIEDDLSFADDLHRTQAWKAEVALCTERLLQELR